MPGAHVVRLRLFRTMRRWRATAPRHHTRCRRRRCRRAPAVRRSSSGRASTAGCSSACARDSVWRAHKPLGM
eukprot:2138729-Prymnesium_polylepis.1